jgi:NitT/TauT family transport system permease protein
MPVMLIGPPEKRDELMRMLGNWLKRIFTPNEVISQTTFFSIVAAWFVLWLTYWVQFKPDIFPSPVDIVQALPNLWSIGGLGQEVISSFTVNLEAMFWSILIAFPLAYLCRTPAIRPLAIGVSKLRFLSPIVFFMILLYAFSTGHQVKVAILALGEIFFLTTTMMGVVDAIPEYRFDDARTLRMSEVKSIWYVVIRGTLHQAFDAIRDNAAMGWSMLMMVEGVVRSEGGVGVMLINNEKHVNFAEVYAIALTIIVVGILQDYILGVGKHAVCPYAVNNG